MSILAKYWALRRNCINLFLTVAWGQFILHLPLVWDTWSTSLAHGLNSPIPITLIVLTWLLIHAVDFSHGCMRLYGTNCQSGLPPYRLIKIWTLKQVGQRSAVASCERRLVICCRRVALLKESSCSSSRTAWTWCKTCSSLEAWERLSDFVI